MLTAKRAFAADPVAIEAQKMMGKKSEFFGARLVITRCINYVCIQGSFKIRIIRRITIVFHPVRDVLGYEELSGI